MKCIVLGVLIFNTVLYSQKPFLCFSDIVSGPATGNSDLSQPGQIENKDGAIVTIYGKNIGKRNEKSTVLVGSTKARIYTWEEAIKPADLFSHLKLYKIEFQIPGSLKNGNTTIIIINRNGDTSNAIPFRIRPGNIYFVKTTGNDYTNDGSWSKPWATLDNQEHTGALSKLLPGDILYIGDSVVHTAVVGDRACIDMGDPGTKEMPKAIIAYPGATVSIGDSLSPRTFSLWVSGFGPTVHFTISKLKLTSKAESVSMYHGFRVVGNHISAPMGDGPTGAVAGQGNDLFLLGNELTHIGHLKTSKLYHPIYIQSAEACSGKRLPLEQNRDIGWNYLHDNLAYDGINLYRECGSSAYMIHHKVHDNFILNQTGCGIRIGDYVVGENWVYSNVVINAGLGPDPPNEQAMHVPVYIHAGWDDTSTLIHFVNNTIYGGGYTEGAEWSSSMVGFGNQHPYTLDFRNNIFVSTDPRIKYLNPRLDIPRSGVKNNLWYGSGIGPIWDSLAISQKPIFENESLFDLRLKENSTGINGGIRLLTDSFFIDFDGNQRVVSNIDLGAYEYQKLLVSFKRNISNESYHIFPNPASEFILVKLNKSTPKEHTINWFDSSGRLLEAKKVKPVAGILKISLPPIFVQGWLILKIDNQVFKIEKIK